MSFSENTNHLQIAARVVAFSYMGVSLIFFLTNILCLYVLIGAPNLLSNYITPSSLQIEQDVPDNDGLINGTPSYGFHKTLASLFLFQQKEYVIIFTITLLYFLLEIYLAKMLMYGVMKLDASKCRIWCDVRKIVACTNTLSLCVNIYHWKDQSTYASIHSLLIVMGCLGIWIVTKLINVVNEYRLTRNLRSDKIIADLSLFPQEEISNQSKV